MLYVNGTAIQMTRGDTAYLTITLKDSSTGRAYTMASGDILKFTVKKNITDTTTIIAKTLTGTNTFKILPADTSSLAFGKYLYDVQLTKENGDVSTVIVPSAFSLLKEVTI